MNILIFIGNLSFHMVQLYAEQYTPPLWMNLYVEEHEQVPFAVQFQVTVLLVGSLQREVLNIEVNDDIPFTKKEAYRVLSISLIGL